MQQGVVDIKDLILDEEFRDLYYELGNSYLNDFSKNEIALKYEDLVLKKSENFKTTDSVRHFTRSCHILSKMIGTTESSLERTKYILAHGSMNQIARARKGGLERDGTSNSMNAIMEEIKEDMKERDAPKKIFASSATKKCTRCGGTYPITDFSENLKNSDGLSKTCKKCRDYRAYKDLKGNYIHSASISVTEEELKNTLYNQDRDMGYTIDELIEELTLNGNSAIDSIKSSLEIHKELITNNWPEIKKVIDGLCDKLNQIGGQING